MRGIGCWGRICIISEDFYPEDPGGQGSQAYLLAKSLRAHGLHVLVVSRKILSESSDEEDIDGLHVWRLHCPGVWRGKGWRALGPTSRFLQLMAAWLIRHRKEYDTLLVHGVKGVLLPTVLISKLCRKRLVVKVDAAHEVENVVTNDSLRAMGYRASATLVQIWRVVRNALLRQAAAVIAISMQIRELLLREGVSDEKILRIPNGIDVGRFSPIDSEAKTLLRSKLCVSGSPLVIYTGRIAHTKGLITLLHAWKEVVRRHPEACLLLVGSGTGSHDDCESELRSFVAHHDLTQQVSFVGQVDNVPEYLQAADIFVLPSQSEGFGLSLVEAMATGLPCISTRVGIAPDIIEQGINGVLVPIDHTDALAAALTGLMDNSHDRAAMGLAARNSVTARFDITVVSGLYASVLAQPALTMQAALKDPLPTERSVR